MTLASLVGIHAGFSWVVVLANGVAGAWALAAHRWHQLRTRALWWFTAAAEIAVFVQAGLGVGLVAGQERQATDDLHMFYGFLAIIAVGIVYSYGQQMARHRFLLYGGGGLFIMGLAIRAMVVDVG